MHTYFDDLTFSGADDVADCHFQLDFQSELLVLNFVADGAIHYRRADDEVVARGTAVVTAASTVLEAPCLFWTVPHGRYVYGNVAGRNWYQVWIAAFGTRVDRMIESGLVPTEGTHTQALNPRSSLISHMHHLVTSVMEDSQASHETCVRLFEDAFALLHEERTRSPSHAVPHAEEIQSLAWRVLEEPTRGWDFQQEARRLGLSYHHLRRLFQQTVGEAPQQYVLKCRMRHAAYLLTNTNDSLQAIAETCGCESSHYFSRLFKSRMGISPSLYRSGFPRDHR